MGAVRVDAACAHLAGAGVRASGGDHVTSDLPCLLETTAPETTRPIWPVRPDGLAARLDALPAPARAYAEQAGFTAEAQSLLLLPGESGVAGALLGLGTDPTPFAFGGLATRLPASTAWHLEPGDYDMQVATLGYCLGAYHYADFKAVRRAPALLRKPVETNRAIAEAAAVWMVRDLINTPANLLGPSELAEAASRVALNGGASVQRIAGDALVERYPVLAAVGAGSTRPPVVVRIDWRGSGARDDSPLIALCGKGIVFDTGGYDLKPSAAMLRMKKDMGGAAQVLGVLRLVMELDLPVRLAVWIGCAENSISGAAMRPSDVLRSRHGLSIEVGNTDAEGRLLLCDLLAEASAAAPAMLIDYATLTGAARVALGPDLPALFCNDEALASRFVAAATAVHDPVWRLPLWSGYAAWLDSGVADVNSVASKPMAGAIVAALFLQRFVGSTVPWAHIDVYAWNDSGRPGRPEGGEAQAMRAALQLIAECANAPLAKHNA